MAKYMLPKKYASIFFFESQKKYMPPWHIFFEFQKKIYARNIKNICLAYIFFKKYMLSIYFLKRNICWHIFFFLKNICQDGIYFKKKNSDICCQKSRPPWSDLPK